MSQYLKNIPYEEVLKLSDLVNIGEGQVVSKTLVQNEALSITVFAFSKGEEIGTHDSAGDALVTILEGTGKFIVDGTEYLLDQGQSLIMPAQKPHSVYAAENFKMLLTVVFQ